MSKPEVGESDFGFIVNQKPRPSFKPSKLLSHRVSALRSRLVQERDWAVALPYFIVDDHLDLLKLRVFWRSSQSHVVSSSRRLQKGFRGDGF